MIPHTIAGDLDIIREALADTTAQLTAELSRLGVPTVAVEAIARQASDHIAQLARIGKMVDP